MADNKDKTRFGVAGLPGIGQFASSENIGLKGKVMSAGTRRQDNCFKIPVEQIIPYQGKGDRDFTQMGSAQFEELVQSIKEVGQMEPAIVRVAADGKYELLAGEHRWRACKEAGVATLSAVVLKDVDDDLAEAIFSGSNYFRRTSTLRDMIIGASRYVQRKGPQRMTVLAGYEAAGLGVGDFQLKRYAKVGSLPNEMIDAVEQKRIPLNVAADTLTQLSQEHQTDLIRWGLLTMNTVQGNQVLKLQQDGTWEETTVKDVFQKKPRVKVAKTWTDVGRLTGQAMKGYAKQKELPKQIISRMPDLIIAAVDEYLTNHPELLEESDPASP